MKCPNCAGTGKVTYWNPQTNKKEKTICTWCKGTGGFPISSRTKKK